MKVGRLIELLRGYPVDMEVMIGRVDPNDGAEVDAVVFDVDKVRMKEVTLDVDGPAAKIASDYDFDEDADVENRIIIFPEV